MINYSTHLVLLYLATKKNYVGITDRTGASDNGGVVLASNHQKRSIKRINISSLLKHARDTCFDLSPASSVHTLQIPGPKRQHKDICRDRHSFNIMPPENIAQIYSSCALLAPHKRWMTAPRTTTSAPALTALMPVSRPVIEAPTEIKFGGGVPRLAEMLDVAVPTPWSRRGAPVG